jgi:hypothetical protein
MTEYYREGTFDNCRHKWTELFGCISLKTKPQSQIQSWQFITAIHGEGNGLTLCE